MTFEKLIKIAINNKKFNIFSRFFKSDFRKTTNLQQKIKKIPHIKKRENSDTFNFVFAIRKYKFFYKLFLL